jgi:phosphoribosylglycinamide formyltransferase 2
MKIGTALTRNTTKAVLLGSGELGKEIAISLQRYGVEVIAVDRYPNAPAHPLAHKAYVIDMTDATALKHLIATEKPDFIIPEIEAIATDALADIEAQGDCMVIPNAKAVQLTMNREGIRNLAAEKLGLPTSAYAFVTEFDQLKAMIDQNIGYPCFIKPTMSSSGKGQSLVKNSQELAAAWTIAKQQGRVATGKVIVEACIKFDFEITLLTVRAFNHQGKIETYFCEPIGHRQEQGDYRESWQPQAMTKNALKTAQQIAKAITDEIGGLGVFGVELFVKSDQVWFSEVSPRPHDTGMVTMVTQRQNEFDLHVRAILGLPISTQLQTPGASAVILSGINRKAIRYDGLANALRIPNTEVRLFGKPEAFVSRRMGVAMSFAPNTDAARVQALNAAQAINIITDEEKNHA